MKTDIESFLSNSKVIKTSWSLNNQTYKVFAWNPEEFWNRETNEMSDFSHKEIVSYFEKKSNYRMQVIHTKLATNETLLILAFYN